jgi:2-polyprenyl-3-methyl-5-hydroxy-6-metoxy-1,4-benzoquinol methylase
MKNFNLPDNFYLKEKMLELYETGSYFVNLPSRSDQSFEEGYHSEPVDPDGHVRQLISDDERAHKLMNFQKEIIDELYLVTSEKRTIIDIGCGPGWLLSTLDDSWNKFGVEISSFAADIAKQHGDIACISVENFVAPLESFDVVILHHVIEHLADPLQVIEKIHQMLKPGGLLIIGTPDFDCAAARRYGNNFRLLHDQTHISLFSNDSMHRFLRDNGFKVKKVEYPFFETDYFCESNLLKLFEDDQVSPPFYGSIMTFFATKV